MSNKRLAIMLLFLGLMTWGCAIMVLRGAAAQMSAMNKLPGILSEEHGLFEDYGLTPVQLESMIDESVWFQSEWLWLAVLLLGFLGLLEELSGIVYFVRSRK
tara:strand:- start:73364 stop:73669 length:306 start_codon:yes stop_codon:yes gene_type:complete